MGILWHEEEESPHEGCRKRTNALGVIMEDSDFDETDSEYELFGPDDGWVYPHIVPMHIHDPKHQP